MVNHSNDLDEIDEEIVRLLQRNARISVADICREIGELTENAIRYRINKLEEKGYIKNYTIQLDFKKFGKNQVVIFNLNVPPKNIQDAVTYLESFDNITDIYLTSGKNTIVAIGYFEDNKDVSRFVTENLKRIKTTDFDIITVLDRVKHRLYGI